MRLMVPGASEVKRIPTLRSARPYSKAPAKTCRSSSTRHSPGVTPMQLSNYLFFTTACEQAVDFYTQCGLGKVVEVLRYGANDMPLKNESMRGKIMHARFEGPGVLFY